MPRAVVQPPMPTLEASLNTRNADDLRRMAQAVTSERLPTRKADLLAVVKQALLDVEQVKTLFAKLSQLEQHIVAEVLYNLGGRYNAAAIDAKYDVPNKRILLQGSIIHIGYGARQKPVEPYELFFHPGIEIVRCIPTDFGQVLAQFVPKPPVLERVGSPEPPPALKSANSDQGQPTLLVSQNEQAIFHDLAATLSLISQDKVTVSATTHMPNLASLRAVRERLLIGDFFSDTQYARAEDAIRPLALVLMVQAAKWASPNAKQKLALSRAGEKLLTSAIDAGHVRQLWEHWLRSTLLDELSRVRGIKGQQARDTRLTKPSERRTMLVEALADYPANQWFLFTTLLREMRIKDALPAIERTEHVNLYVGTSHEYGWLGYSGSRYWDVVQGSYLRVLLWEYAATLGLVEIAYTDAESTPHDFGEIYGMDDEPISRYDGLWAFKLTELGAFVFGHTKQYTPSAPKPAGSVSLLRILPNFDLVITDAARLLPNDRSFLERIGTVESQDVYRLNRDTILESTEYGLTIEQIQEFLANRSGVAPAEFPQTVRVFFEDLAQRINKLREGGRMAVLESDDPYILTQLANAPGMRGVVRLATVDGATVLLIPEDQESVVRKQLKKLGYIPRKRS